MLCKELLFMALMLRAVAAQPSDGSITSEAELGLSLEEITSDDELSSLNDVGTRSRLDITLPHTESLQTCSDIFDSEDPNTRGIVNGCSSEDDVGMSLNGMSSDNSDVPDVNSSTTENDAGVSLDGMSDSSDELNLIDVFPVTGEEQMDVETVRVHIPPPRDISSFLLSEVSSGKKMKLKALSLLSIKSALKDTCQCGAACLRKFSVKTLRDLRQFFWLNSRSHRMQLLRHYVTHSEKIGKFRLIKVENDLLICSKAFMTALRINKNTFSRALNMTRKDVVTVSSKKPRDMCSKTLNLMTWLEDYATYHGDRMPNSVDIVLPYGTVKTSLYARYCQETLVYSPHVISRSQFFRIWESHFPHLKIKKTNSFSKCTTCTTLERQLEKTTDVSTRAKYRQLKEEHNKRQMLERKYYYSKREASRRDPDKYMSIIIDGMDQSKTNLPHFIGRRAKNVNVADLLKTHITGVINHGHGGFHTYIDINEYPHDPNLTMNIILKILKKTAESNRNELPPILYIQADNCWRENKNRYVLAFCNLLVAENIFSEVHLSFLYVGHTHEDVDAAFSRISECLRTTDAETMEDLTSLLPRSEIVSVMFDVKSWLAPYINDITGHTEPLHFLFKRQDELVQCHFKGQHTDPWIELQGPVVTQVPFGEPSVLRPDYSGINVERQLKQVEVLQPFFKKGGNFNTWKRFYNNIANQTRQPAGNETWPLKHLPRQSIASRESIYRIIPEVRELVQKETNAPKVTLRRKVSTKENNGCATKRTHTRKNSGRVSKRFAVVKRKLLVPVRSTDEEKIHIWWIIFVKFLERNFSVIVLLFIIIYIYICLFCLVELVKEMTKIFLVLVGFHVGHYSARAKTEKIKNTVLAKISDKSNVDRLKKNFGHCIGPVLLFPHSHVLCGNIISKHLTSVL